MNPYNPYQDASNQPRNQGTAYNPYQNVPNQPQHQGASYDLYQDASNEEYQVSQIYQATGQVPRMFDLVGQRTPLVHSRTPSTVASPNPDRHPSTSARPMSASGSHAPVSNAAGTQRASAPRGTKRRREYDESSEGNRPVKVVVQGQQRPKPKPKPKSKPPAKQ